MSDHRGESPLEAARAAAKFAAQAPGALQASVGPRLLPREPTSPLLELTRLLDRLSVQLRHYVAGFETFRAAKERCDELYDAVTTTGTGFQHWDRISDLVGRVGPATLEPPLLDEDWAPDIGPHVEAFKRAWEQARDRVENFLVTGGAPDQRDLDEARSRVRSMRGAIRDALETCGRRADRLAEEVRKCAEKISMLLPREVMDLVAESATSAEAKLREAAAAEENPLATPLSEAHRTGAAEIREARKQTLPGREEA